MATRKKSGGSKGGFGTFLFGFICALLVAGAGAWAYLHFDNVAPAVGHWNSARKQLRNRAPLSGDTAEQSPATEGPVNGLMNEGPVNGPVHESARNQPPGTAAPGSAAPVMQPPVNPPLGNGSSAPPSAPVAHTAESIQQPPFEASEDVFEAGAHIYKQRCAGCHGIPGQDSAFARQMQPPASQLWTRHVGGSAVGVSEHAPGQTFQQVKDGIHFSGMPSYKHVLSDNQIWDVSLLLQSAGQPLPDPVLAILRHQ
jgi:mono/diheme cytochrome c family protein